MTGTRIYPFNRNVFGDDEFLPADVTDRPEEHSQNSSEAAQSTETGNDTITKDQSLLQPANVNIRYTKSTHEVTENPPSPQQETSLVNMILGPVPSTSSDILNRFNLCKSPPSTQIDQRATCEIKTPEALRPFKKASPRKTQNVAKENAAQ